MIAPPPDRARLVEAYGGAGDPVTAPADPDVAIERRPATPASGGSAWLDVLVEP